MGGSGAVDVLLLTWLSSRILTSPFVTLIPPTFNAWFWFTRLREIVTLPLAKIPPPVPLVWLLPTRL